MKISVPCAILAFLWSLIPPVVWADSSPGKAAPSDLVAAPPFSVPAEGMDRTALAEAQSRLDGFSQSTGTHWRAVDWAPASVTPALASGSGLDLSGPIEDANAAAQVARTFVLAHPELFATFAGRTTVALAMLALLFPVAWLNEVATRRPMRHS